ncbi:hypothetical protein ACU611_08455 [Klebsiella aerogenes]|uniref:hypothetical protein n=1 Tax=Enterobacterales TaxID=91347 RepID=UPI000F84A36D|nr:MULTISPECIES: hypothetical protein [Enterobacterales]KAA8672724.1 hypothetical protein F4W08_04750 [Pantoea dispersa]MBT2090685.1 hypothetical protein [Enterobacter bugandensis]RTQ02467.1 hypothetical protein EKN38_07990 [Enterobacter sp. WCHEn045836]
MNYPEFSGTKILVIGRPCSGKTTLAEKLSSELGIPAYDMDDLNWKDGWQRVDIKEINNQLGFILAKKSWIISGDYLNTLPVRLAHATDLIILDIRWYRAAFRYFKRIFKRAFGNERHAGYGKWYQEINLFFFIKKVLFYDIYAKRFNRNIKTLYPDITVHNY